MHVILLKVSCKLCERTLKGILLLNYLLFMLKLFVVLIDLSMLMFILLIYSDC